jgi:hypothetical protein
MPTVRSVLWLAALLGFCPMAKARVLQPQPCKDGSAIARETYRLHLTDATPAMEDVLVAAIDGRLDALRTMLAPLPADQRDRWRQAALLQAVMAGQTAVADGLLTDGADPDGSARLPALKAAFVEAALEQDKPLRDAATRTGARYAPPGTYGAPIVVAADCGDRQMADLLLRHKAAATISEPASGVDALALATLHGDAYMVQALLDHGATACAFDAYLRAHGSRLSPREIGKRAGLPDELVERLVCRAG